MNLEPGPELDAGVAKAIGLKSFVVMDGRVLINEEELRESLGHESRGWGTVLACHPWSPSTDVAEALKLAEDVFRDFYIWHNDSGSCYHVYASFRRRIQEDCEFKAMGDTLPEALCLAILKSKEQP